MPYRPAIHRPAGAGAGSRARAARQRERLEDRPTAAQRGYDAEWRVVRKLHLLEFPSCSVENCDRPATDVDHVESIAVAPERRLDPSNLRSLCKQHHSQRTGRDQGGFNLEPRAARHPTWLGPSRVPLTIVCGPPGSGKSTWVRERAGARDLVLDLDEIASSLSSLPLYCAPASFLDRALRFRNSRLKLLSITRSWPAAWLIVSEPKAKWREWWRSTLQPYRVVVFETSAEKCFERIERDERRPALLQARHRDAVVEWWSTYQRSRLDVILRPGERPTTGARSPYERP